MGPGPPRSLRGFLGSLKRLEPRRVLLGMPFLENPPENPCFGCGPNHPRGLRLAFRSEVADDGTQEVRGEFTPKSDEVGWPTLFHHGLHFTVLYEASYWAALTLGGKLWVSTGPITYSADRLPRVGLLHTVSARLIESADTSLRARAETHGPGGKLCGRLDSAWRPASRAVAERAGIPLPEYLVAEMDP